MAYKWFVLLMVVSGTALMLLLLQGTPLGVNWCMNGFPTGHGGVCLWRR
jgi:hypothetical protein